MTVVNAGSVCHSACAFAWLAEHIMQMARDASIGTHAAFVEKGGVKLATGAGNAVAGAYLRDLGFPGDAIAALVVPPDEAFVIPPEVCEERQNPER